MKTDDLRKAARCILLATEASVATDLQERLEWAATRIEALEAEDARLRAALDAVVSRCNTWAKGPAHDVRHDVSVIARRALGKEV